MSHQCNSQPSESFPHSYNTVRLLRVGPAFFVHFVNQSSVLQSAHPCRPAKGQGSCAMIPLTPRDTLKLFVPASPASSAADTDLTPALLPLLLLLLVLLLPLASASFRSDHAQLTRQRP